MWEEIAVAGISGVIIGAIMTAMLYITAPKMTPRFLKGANVDERIKSITSSLDAKILTLSQGLDARVEKIFSNDVPKVIDGVVAKAEKIIDYRVQAAYQFFNKYTDEKLPEVIDGMMEDLMSEDNIKNIKTIISSSVAEGLTPIAQTVKMAFIGKKGNEAQADTKAGLEGQKALIETALQSHPQGNQALALAKQFDFDLPKMAAENPELAKMGMDMFQNFMSKQGGGPGGGQGGSVNTQYVTV